MLLKSCGKYFKIKMFKGTRNAGKIRTKNFYIINALAPMWSFLVLLEQFEGILGAVESEKGLISLINHTKFDVPFHP